MKFDEKELIRQAQSTNKLVSEPAMTQLVLTYKSFIKSIASKFTKYEIDFDDLMSYANRGFIKAVINYNLSSTNKLSTYAYLWIIQSIQLGLADINMIYIPEKTLKLYWQIQDFKQTFFRSYSFIPSTTTIAKELGKTTDRIENAMKVVNKVYSFDKTIDDEDKVSEVSIIADDKPNPEDLAIQDEAKTQLLSFLKNNLTPIQLKVLIWSYGLDPNIGKLQAKQIAKKLHISVPNVRKIQYGTLALLRNSEQLQTINKSF